MRWEMNCERKSSVWEWKIFNNLHQGLKFNPALPIAYIMLHREDTLESVEGVQIVGFDADHDGRVRVGQRSELNRAIYSF